MLVNIFTTRQQTLKVTKPLEIWSMQLNESSTIVQSKLLEIEKETNMSCDLAISPLKLSM